MSAWNFADVWEAVAAQVPDRECVVQGERRLTWREFDAHANALARILLDAGLRRQNTVALYMYNCSEYLEATSASFKAGLVPVNTNYRYGPDELRYLWRDAQPAAVVFHSSFAPVIDTIRGEFPDVRLWVSVPAGDTSGPEWAVPYRQVTATAVAGPVRGPWGRSPDDLFVLYTGGTTGLPKGVMWRQDDMFGNLNEAALNRYPDDGDAGCVAALLPGQPPLHLPACPLMHGAGSITSMSAFSQGGTVALLEARSFDAVEMLDTIERERVSTIAITGDAIARPLADALDNAGRAWDLSSVIYIVSSAATWSEQVKRRIARHAPHVRLVDTLGSSEGMGAGRSVRRGDMATRTGHFIPGRHTRVLDDDGHDVEPGSGTIGAIVVGGRQPIGYFNDPHASARTWRSINGQRYAISGDYATVAGDGSLTLVGRGSLVINTGGEKVFPQEVEEALKTHPDVLDAGVVGVADERFGERVVALVQPVPGRRPDADALIRHVRSRLAGYKAPRAVRFVDELDRAPSGKLDYLALRQRARQQPGPRGD